MGHTARRRRRHCKSKSTRMQHHVVHMHRPMHRVSCPPGRPARQTAPSRCPAPGACTQRAVGTPPWFGTRPRPDQGWQHLRRRAPLHFTRAVRKGTRLRLGLIRTACLLDSISTSLGLHGMGGMTWGWGQCGWAHSKSNRPVYWQKGGSQLCWAHLVGQQQRSELPGHVDD